MQVPYSAGRQLPTIAVPAGTCDCHHHIFDPVRFPYVPTDVRNQPPATIDAYRMLQRKLGVSRNVIVQPSAYGTDNRCTLAALEIFGADARAVVAVDHIVSHTDLRHMHELGVRGVRFNLAMGASYTPDAIRSIAHRVADLDWHTQFWMSADDTVALADVLFALPTQVVFDHRAHLTQPQGMGHPAFGIVCRLVDKGRTWVKISAPYIDSDVGPPTYADTIAIGRAFVQVAPERVLWGTDWPHPSVLSDRQPWPDDARILDQLVEQAPDASVRQRILVDNPAALYGFGREG